jgi:hypothetical protein
MRCDGFRAALALQRGAGENCISPLEPQPEWLVRIEAGLSVLLGLRASVDGNHCGVIL